MLTVGSLFAGIGGFDLGLERAGMRVIWQSEIDPYASAVLKKHWPDVPNHGDIRSIHAGNVQRPDVLCGGFPCQPYSVAGERMGADDDRALWPECARLVEEFRPDWFIGENVVGIVGMAIDDMLTDLESLGYSTRAFDIPAGAVGAPHERRRIFMVANANSDRQQGRQLWLSKDECAARPSASEGLKWNDLPSPAFCRGTDGIPNRTHRLRALGNAIVPQIAEIIGRAIVEANP